MRGWRAAAAVLALAATAAEARPADPERIAEEESILAEAGIVVPCRFGRFAVRTTLPGQMRRGEVRIDYLLVSDERRRRDASVSMTVRFAFGASDDSELEFDRAILANLLTALTPVRDYAGAPGPAGAVGRAYRFQSEGRPAMVGSFHWRRGERRIQIQAWAYGTRYREVWTDIERLVAQIAAPREPRGRSRGCPSLLDLRPVLQVN